MAIFKRRQFLQCSAVFSSLAVFPGYLFPKGNEMNTIEGNLKLSLNAYSFNGPLTKGEISLEEVMEFCSLHKFQAIDITAYYFPGYPEVPTAEHLFEIKRRAFTLGLDISGTGVRNDFTDPDPGKRRRDVEMTKNWIKAASKLGAPVIRIFSGTKNPEGYTWDQIASWMVKDIVECVAFGKEHGVVVAIQNHSDFLKTADQTIQILEEVNSDWFGLILDTGSFGIGDPYEEIAKTIPYAVSWQVKELINHNGQQVPVDLQKLMGMIKKSGYNGYLPIETLGPGDPRKKVPEFLYRVREAMRG